MGVYLPLISKGLCPKYMNQFYKTIHQKPITQEKNGQEVLKLAQQKGNNEPVKGAQAHDQ